MGNEERPEDLAKAWGGEGLDRCHLIPRAKGGPDTPDNLVLLCSECHKEAPDCLDPNIMLRWIARRESYWMVLSRKLTVAAETAGLELEEIVDWHDLVPEAIRQVEREAILAPGDNMSAVLGIVAQRLSSQVSSRGLTQHDSTPPTTRR